MRYKVDLKRYMADCEANYARLMKLFPKQAVDSERLIGLQHGDHRVVVLSILERTPYTTLVCLQQSQPLPSTAKWLALPELDVRLYHDAKVAEVVNLEGVRRPQPRCQYPNGRMHQRDEKAQWNRFLGEWLSQCINFGYCAEPLFEPMSD